MAELSLLPTKYNSGHSKDLKVGLSSSSKVIFICLKMMKNTFYFILKAFLLSFRFSPLGIFVLTFLVKFKICDVINWKIKNYHQHIAQFLKR